MKIVIVLLFLFLITCTRVEAPMPQSGISGIITIGPMCPVVSNENIEECADRPYQAEVIVKLENGKKEIARFTSTEKGEFTIALFPGVYLLKPLIEKMGSFFPPYASTQLVTVEEGNFTYVVIQYDSGIR